MSQSELEFENVYYGAAKGLKEAMLQRGMEWFSLSNVHKVTATPHTDLKHLFAQLSKGGLIKHDVGSNKYCVVLDKNDRVAIIESNLSMINATLKNVMLNKEMIERWLGVIKKLD